MAKSAASNPTPTPGKNAYPGGVRATRKVGGSTRRTAPAPTGRQTRGQALTTHGGQTGGTPEAGRKAQDAANGTVHGQPRSGQRDNGRLNVPFSSPDAMHGDC